MSPFTIRPIHRSDRAWVVQFVREQWGTDLVAVHDAVYHPADLPGFLALDDDPVGLITYRIDGNACEIVSLNSLQPRHGIGTALIEHVVNVARRLGCHRVWLITTNDNLNALGFFQKRGFVFVEVRRDAVNQSRKIKPEIPLVGENGIPIRDEIELQMIL